MNNGPADRHRHRARVVTCQSRCPKLAASIQGSSLGADLTGINKESCTMSSRQTGILRYCLVGIFPGSLGSGRRAIQSDDCEDRGEGTTARH
jgi:hypothetical protein